MAGSFGCLLFKRSIRMADNENNRPWERDEDNLPFATADPTRISTDPAQFQTPPDAEYEPDVVITEEAIAPVIKPPKRAFKTNPTGFDKAFAITNSLFFILLSVILMIYAIDIMQPIPICAAFASIAYAFSTVYAAKKGRYPVSVGKALLRSVSMAILLPLMIGMVHTPFKSFDEDRYRSLRRYEENAYNIKDDFLPWELPDDIDDYQFSGKTVNGVKYVSLRFSASKKEIRYLTDDLSFSLLKGSRPLSWYTEAKKKTMLTKYNAYVPYDEYFWDGYEDGATICIEEMSGTRENPKIRVVVVNTEEGMIEYISVEK